MNLRARLSERRLGRGNQNLMDPVVDGRRILANRACYRSGDVNEVGIFDVCGSALHRGRKYLSALPEHLVDHEPRALGELIRVDGQLRRNQTAGFHHELA